VFSTSDGSYLRSFPAADNEAVALPVGLSAGPNETLFLSDVVNGRVLVFSTDGTFVESVGRRGNRYGDMGHPRGTAVGPDGVLFVADPEFGHVHLFSGDGQLLMLLGAPASDPGATPAPIDVAIATALPAQLAELVPDDFVADYFLFVANRSGSARISLFAIGRGR
jgi:hypothetical protein